jgi:hypothetical protein
LPTVLRRLVADYLVPRSAHAAIWSFCVGRPVRNVFPLHNDRILVILRDCAFLLLSAFGEKLFESDLQEQLSCRLSDIDHWISSDTESIIRFSDQHLCYFHIDVAKVELRCRTKLNSYIARDLQSFSNPYVSVSASHFVLWVNSDIYTWDFKNDVVTFLRVPVQMQCRNAVITKNDKFYVMVQSSKKYPLTDKSRVCGRTNDDCSLLRHSRISVFRRRNFA